jgi:nucleotide-binding universal stress UspA family protein
MSQTKIIVSYDGTNNENDAIALAGLFAKAGAQVSLAYVRHTNEAVSDEEAQEVLDRGAALFNGTFASSHAITDRSTPEGLRALAQHEGADAIVFCSDSHTARGSVSVGNSAQRLLDGGRFAIAIAPAGLAEHEPVSISAIAATEDPTDNSARATAESLAAALGASVLASADQSAQLLVIGSRPEAGEGQVALSAAALNRVENSTSAVLIVPRSVALAFGRVAALSV